MSVNEQNTNEKVSVFKCFGHNTPDFCKENSPEFSKIISIYSHKKTIVDSCWSRDCVEGFENENSSGSEWSTSFERLIDLGLVVLD